MNLWKAIINMLPSLCTMGIYTKKGKHYMRLPLFMTHSPYHTSTVCKIPCSPKVFKDLIFSASHFSVPSIGYDIQINQNRSVELTSV